MSMTLDQLRELRNEIKDLEDKIYERVSCAFPCKRRQKFTELHEKLEEVRADVDAMQERAEEAAIDRNPQIPSSFGQYRRGSAVNVFVIMVAAFMVMVPVTIILIDDLAVNAEPKSAAQAVEPPNLPQSWDMEQRTKPQKAKTPQTSWQTVTASREGLVGEKTATGHIIGSEDVFVALPDRSALGKRVMVKHNDITIIAPVRDVGPWSIKDDYWNHNRRPLAEEGKRLPSRWGEARNPAAIDLSNGLWDSLKIPRGRGLANVQWRFYNERQ